MKYTKKDIYDGMKLKCIRTAETKRWRIGSVYTITKNKIGDIILVDDLGLEWNKALITDFLNDFGHVYFKEENNMQEFKVGDLVEVISNTSWAVNEIGEPYNKGDLAIITNVYSTTVRLGNNPYANLIKKTEVKKVEKSPELTDYEEKLVLRLAKCIKNKDDMAYQIELSKNNIKVYEKEIEKDLKEIKEISKKLLTK